MRTAPRGRMAGSLLAIAVAATSLVSAQLDGGGPGRQPAPADIAQEWRLDNNERDTFGQAPLGDYTGVPFNDAGRSDRTRRQSRSGARSSTNAGRTPPRISGAASAGRAFSRNRTR